MKLWFIEILNKQNDLKLTIYEDGSVYGKERGLKYGVLVSSAMEELFSIINENMYMFRKLKYYKENVNPFILKVNDTCKQHRTIKIVGWSQMPRIMKVVSNKSNYKAV